MMQTKSHNGHTIATEDGMPFWWYLTPCCNASAKGSSNSETGVICRACYEDIDAFYGGIVEVSA